MTLPEGYGVAAVDDPTPCEREADDEAPLDASPLAESVREPGGLEGAAWQLACLLVERMGRA